MLKDGTAKLHRIIGFVVSVTPGPRSLRVCGSLHCKRHTFRAEELQMRQSPGLSLWASVLRPLRAAVQDHASQQVREGREDLQTQRDLRRARRVGGGSSGVVCVRLGGV